MDVSYVISEILGGWNDLEISFRVIKSGTTRKLYEFLIPISSLY